MHRVIVERIERDMEMRTRYNDNAMVIATSQTAAPINHTITTSLNFRNSIKIGT